IGVGALTLNVPGLIDSGLASAAKPRKKPNFIIIMADDLGYGDLACYGSKWIKTPNLDKMADEGMKFTSFYVAGAVCTPSRAALMTGCYPQRVGMPSVILPNCMPEGQIDGKAIGLNPNEVTVAEVLKDVGYKTACVGKWHLGDVPEFLPTRQGFDEYFGLPYSNDMTSKRQRPSNKEPFPPLPLMRNEEVIETEPDQSLLTKQYTEEAIKFIKKNKDKPFFLYLAHTMPHLPVYVSESFSSKYDKDFFESVAKGGRKALRVLYPAVVEEIDWGVGRILEALKESGIDENTIVIFTSDNGPATGETGPLSGGKGSMFEGGIRVPCIMRWPDKMLAGKVCNEMCTTMDFLPTFAKLTGGKVPDDRIIDGKDIQALMAAEPNAESPYEAFYYINQYRGVVAVRSGRWKLFVTDHSSRGHTVKAMSLYNLANDLGEKTNVAIAYRDKVPQLHQMVSKFSRELCFTSRPAGMAKPKK
ncbi:MAG: sulfatase family protein, partial [Planctomycetota bacterium]